MNAGPPSASRRVRAPRPDRSRGLAHLVRVHDPESDLYVARPVSRSWLARPGGQSLLRPALFVGLLALTPVALILTVPIVGELLRPEPYHNVVSTFNDISMAHVSADETDSATLFRIADRICGTADHCGVQFWTDRSMVPSAGLPKGKQLATRIASYVRNRAADVDELVRVDTSSPVPRLQ